MGFIISDVKCEIRLIILSNDVTQRPRTGSKPNIMSIYDVCVAQVTAGRIDWSANEQKCPIEFSASSTIWADDVKC